VELLREEKRYILYLVMTVISCFVRYKYQWIPYTEVFSVLILSVGQKRKKSLQTINAREI